MNMRSMFSQFAAATMGRKLKGSGCSFFSFLFFIQKYDFIDLQRGPLLGFLLQHRVLSWYILCFLKSFSFFHAKCFTSRLLIAPASHHRFRLSYLHSPSTFFFLSLALSLHLNIQKEPSNAWKLTDSESYHLRSLTWLQSLWSPVNMCFQPLFFLP